MQIVLHAGVHFTEEDRLMKCLLRNKEDFAKRGVAVPGPGRYRKLLRETLDALAGGTPSPDARDILMDAILDHEIADRVLLSNANFFGAPRSAVRRGVLFPRAEEQLSRFARLFPNDEIELFLALRNPASFLPAAFEKSPKAEISDFIGDTSPTTIRWSDLLQRLRHTVPQVSITVWCNEDAPLIWAQIIRDMAALNPDLKITGGFDLLASIMSREGMQRFRTYLKTHDTMAEIQKRRVMAAFLDKFALEDEIEEELDLQGWTDALVEEMTDVYDEDVFRIQRIPGVQVISP